MVKTKSLLIILVALFSTHLTAQTIVDRDDDGLIDINYLEDLDAIRNHLNGLPTACGENNDEACTGYELMRSLDFTDNTHYLDADANRARWTTGAGWQPIGDFSNPFNAVLIASTETFTISNLTIDRRNQTRVGLFGVSSGRITDIHLSDVSVKGYAAVGGLVGSNQGQITASSVTGSVEGVSAWVGGLVGSNNGNSSIAYSFARVGVSGYSSVGGLVGYSLGTITDSYAFGDVEARVFGGGLVGYGQGPIGNSYAGGSVESAFYGGGLVGYNDSYTGDNRGSVLSNVYATARVTGGTYVGGLVGYNDSDISNGYAIGRVIGGGGLGGLVGINDDEGVITNSYWDVDTIGQATSDGGTSRTTVQLQMPTAPGATETEIYYNWDPDVWDFGTENDYPILKDEDGNDLPLPELRPGTSLGLGALVLSGLRLSDGMLEPPFDPTKTSYELLDLAGNQTTVTATTLENVIVSIEVDGQTASTGNQVVFAPFMDTVDNVVIRVTATGRSTATYTVVLPDDRPLLGGDPKAPCSLADIDQDDDRLIEICDIEGLYAMRYRLDGSAYKASSAAAEIDRGCPDDGCIGYELMNELDFGNPDHYRDSDNQTIWTVADYSDDSDTGWRPIGDFAAPFNATFKANGHTISGLQINRDDSVNGRDYAGLFGQIGTRAELDGVDLSAIDVRGRFSVGGLVGWSDGGTVINSSVEGNIVGSRADASWASNWIGGMVGINNGAIVNSYAQANVSGHTMIGGLVGAATRDSDILNSYAVGQVNGINYVGGLAGLNQGRFENCYARVSIGGVFFVAGLVAFNDDEGVIENCYAAPDSSAPIAGLVSVNQGTVINSYWQQSDTVSSSDGGTGLTSEALRVSASFPGWLSANWDFTDGEYPGLKYTEGRNPDNPACETPPPDTELPNCEALLAEQRFELEGIELVEARLVPDFDLATDNYVASVSAATTNVRIIVRANREDTPIRINGNVVSVDAVNVVALAETANTQIEVVSVAEATTYTVVVRKITLPLCHASIEFPDDNDGIDQAIDIDKDNDGLIEICDLEGLDEIRYQLDGTGYRASADAEVIRVGCPADGCEGYELTKNLDFTDNDSYRTTANKVMWIANKDRTNSGFPPIARSAILTAIFEGNDYTIANLYININDGTTVGLFSFTLSEIRNVNLSNVDVNGSALVGGLVGLNGGLISNSRMTGSVSGTLSNSSELGGLVGANGRNAQIQ